MKLAVLFALNLMTSMANANDQAGILCTFKTNPQFFIQIIAQPFVNGEFEEKMAMADVTIGGPRLRENSTAIVKKYPIETRVDVGIAYVIDLSKAFGNQSSISLKDIIFAPRGYEKDIGFTGTYVIGNSSTPLVCTYLVGEG